MPKSLPEAAVPGARRQPWIVFAIVAIFVAPILIAWLYVAGVLDWHGQGLLNRGELLTPPVDLRRLPPTLALQAIMNLEPSHWSVLFMDSTACGEKCLLNLDRLITIRGLLGHAGGRVAIHALLGASTDPGGAAARHRQRLLESPATLRAILDAAAPGTPAIHLPAIAFADWRGQLMLYFPASARSQDLMKDLKRLLRASEIR